MQRCTGSKPFLFSSFRCNGCVISLVKSLYQGAGKTALLIFWVTVLAGCDAKTPEATRLLEEPGAFFQSGEVEAPDEWWLSFNDPTLDTLVESALAGLAYRQLRIEYFNGLSDYLAVLTVPREAQQLRRDLLTANLNLLEFSITLYRALAGGFETAGEVENRL
jgi:outer membrane protein TolC